jgi:hypothetical protein
MEATMRKVAIFCIAAAITAFVSGSIIAAGHKNSTTAATTINPTALTLVVGNLPIVQVNEPF